MYDFIEGKLAEKNPAYAVIDAHGVGYLLNISVQTYTALNDVGQPCKLFTHLVVREDALVLFGFSGTDERELFLKLISVSGVGANTARIILSSLTPNEVVQAIIQADAPLLQRIKGIGVKTAQRIIVDLKDKLSKDTGPLENLDFLHNTKKEEALSGLIILGFPKTVAGKALDKVIQTEGSSLTVEQLIRLALKIL